MFSPRRFPPSIKSTLHLIILFIYRLLPPLHQELKLLDCIFFLNIYPTRYYSDINAYHIFLVDDQN